jgi:hypothetical protein
MDCDPLDPGAAGNTNVQPPLGDVDPDNRLVSHAFVPQNCTTPWLVGTPDCMRARAQSTVRVSDRDAGGSEMATVVKTHPRTECPLASPISPIGQQQCNPRTAFPTLRT